MSAENPTIVGPTGGQATQRTNGKGGDGSIGTFSVKSGLAQMLKGGVIMDVVNAEQARIAEEAGACAVMVITSFRIYIILLKCLIGT